MSFIYRIDTEGGQGLPTRRELVTLGLFSLVERGYRSFETRAEGHRIVSHGTIPEAALAGPFEWRKWSADVSFAVIGEQAPTPYSLRRTVARWQTAPVPMGDGNDWEVPVLAGLGPTLGLPLVMMHDAGEWNAVVRERYERTSRLYARLFQSFLMAGFAGCVPPPDFLPLTLAEQATLVSDAMGLVYRVTEPEVTALGLLTTEALEEAMRVIVDSDRLATALSECANELASAEVDG